MSPQLGSDASTSVKFELIVEADVLLWGGIGEGGRRETSGKTNKKRVGEENLRRTTKGR